MPTPSTIPSGPFAIGDDRTAHHRRQEIPAMHDPAGPAAIPAHVHDQPAVTRRRVGADAYRAQGPGSIAATLLAALDSIDREMHIRREVVRKAIAAALRQVTTDEAEVERIVARTMTTEIAAGRL